MLNVVEWWHRYCSGETFFGVLRRFCGFRAASLNQVLSVGDWQYCSQTLRVIFVGLRSFSCFSAQGSEMGGEVGPTQKATLFPSGSVLHPIMNGVLKNTTLGTRLFFIPHNWAICPRVSSGVSVQSANESVQRCAGVRMTTSSIGCRAASRAGGWGGGGAAFRWGVRWKCSIAWSGESFPDCCVFVR